MSDKVRGTTLIKKASLLWEGREVQARRPICQVKFSLGSSSQRQFSRANFICLENFLRGGTKLIIVYRLALGMECRVLRSGTQRFDTPLERASWYVHPGAICALSKAISEAISGCAASTAPHRSLGLQ